MRTRITASIHPLKVWLSDVVGGVGHRTTFRRGIEIELRTDEGVVGLGEASPLPHYSKEHLEDAEEELTRLAPCHVTLPPNPNRCREWIAGFSADARLTCPSARFALEGALVDLCSRHFGLPAAVLVAQMTSESSSLGEREVSKLLAQSDGPALLRSAQRAVARGYRTLKLKIGPPEQLDRDFAAIASLRRALEPSIRLRLDANQSLDLEGIETLLARFQEFEPELFEEPIPARDLLALEGCPVPVAIDESLSEDDLLEKLAPHLTRLDIRAVVLKPAMLGLLRSIELAERANQLGISVVVTHLFDGPVAHATAASLALAFGSERYAQGLAPHPGLLLAPQRRVAGLGGGWLTLAQTPGLPLTETATC